MCTCVKSVLFIARLAFLGKQAFQFAAAILAQAFPFPNQFLWDRPNITPAPGIALNFFLLTSAITVPLTFKPTVWLSHAAIASCFYKRFPKTLCNQYQYLSFGKIIAVTQESRLLRASASNPNNSLPS